jgi:hypothetical protein
LAAVLRGGSRTERWQPYWELAAVLRGGSRTESWQPYWEVAAVLRVGSRTEWWQPYWELAAVQRDGSRNPNLINFCFLYTNNFDVSIIPKIQSFPYFWRSRGCLHVVILCLLCSLSLNTSAYWVFLQFSTVPVFFLATNIASVFLRDIRLLQLCQWSSLLSLLRSVYWYFVYRRLGTVYRSRFKKPKSPLSVNVGYVTTKKSEALFWVFIILRCSPETDDRLKYINI